MGAGVDPGERDQHRSQKVEPPPGYPPQEGRGRHGEGRGRVVAGKRRVVSRIDQQVDLGEPIRRETRGK